MEPRTQAHHTDSVGQRSAARWCACLFMGIVSVARLTAAEPEPVVEPDKPVAEIPAPAYVTLMLARDPAVQAELELSPQQRAAVAGVVAEVDQPLWQLRDVPLEHSRAKLDECLATLTKGLDMVLAPPQRERFGQLVMQARGAKALLAVDIAKRLQLSADQQASVGQIVSAAKEGTLDSQKIFALLNPRQQSALRGMFGPQFDFSQVTQVGCMAPEFHAVDAWINSPPLSLDALRGKVVVVHFWAFGCINCVHNLPHYQAWYEKFPKDELTIVGIHTPETSAERSVDNLRANVRERGIKYPVAFDLAAETWKAWGNNVWPSVYLIDRGGRVRAWWYGELNWEGAKGEEAMRKRIESLLAEE